MGEVLAELRNISKSFPGVKALDNVSFDIRAGEVHALLGENGAGKSTLMKILSGVYIKDEGQLFVGGKEVEFAKPKDAQLAGIGIVHQELNLCRHLTVAENISLGNEPSHGGLLSTKVIKQTARDVLKRLDLDLDPDTIVGHLPVSKQQMVEIAKVLATDAKVIIMDEPTSALTDKEIEELFRIINLLKSQGHGIIYISHRLEELQYITDRITIMRDGQYITTMNFKDTNLEEIIGKMVGRSLEEKFPHVECKRGDEVLKVKHICSDQDVAVKDVSFTAYRGEIIGFAGLMGAGRTELMRAIFGAEKKTGEIFVNGKEVKIHSPGDAINAGIVMAPEDRKKDGLCLRMTVKENMTLPNLSVVNKGMLLKDSKERKVTEDMVKSLRIKTPTINQKVINLSGGNQQKIVVGKWLVRDAQVVIFDEPTRGIDVGAKVEIYNLMNELKKQGIGVIFVSSELPEVLGMADRVLVMAEGVLTADLRKEDTNQEEIMKYASSTKVSDTVKPVD